LSFSFAFHLQRRAIFFYQPVADCYPNALQTIEKELRLPVFGISGRQIFFK